MRITQYEIDEYKDNLLYILERDDKNFDYTDVVTDNFVRKAIRDDKKEEDVALSLML